MLNAHARIQSIHSTIQQRGQDSFSFARTIVNFMCDKRQCAFGAKTYVNEQRSICFEEENR
jgi:hypothetical protein